TSGSAAGSDGCASPGAGEAVTVSVSICSVTVSVTVSGAGGAGGSASLSANATLRPKPEPIVKSPPTSRLREVCVTRLREADAGETPANLVAAVPLDCVSFLLIDIIYVR